MTISYTLLSQQDATTSSAIIEHFSDSNSFRQLSHAEGDSILQRDTEDASKLQVGIDLAKAKGVIDPEYVAEPYIEIDVLGKSPDEVAMEIVSTVEGASGGSGSGKVIVLCGLSGTGKGTTLSKLRQILSEGMGVAGMAGGNDNDNDPPPEVVGWSNGNIFRSVTLLAVTHARQNPTSSVSNKEEEEEAPLDLTDSLTKENLERFMSMLSFEKNVDDGKWDTVLNGLGYEGVSVSSIQNTLLKSPDVSRHIPTVAGLTQGEVILFASKAISLLETAGNVVLLEGRQQTVDYVRSPHRFVLTLSDSTLIGKRRAAQRLMAAAMTRVEEGDDESRIVAVLGEELEKMI